MSIRFNAVDYIQFPTQKVAGDYETNSVQTSEVTVNSTYVDMISAFFDPGFVGTCSHIFFDLSPYGHSSAGSTYTGKWQIKPIGGSWTDLTSEVTGLISTSGYITITGVYTGSITTPFEIKFSVKDDADDDNLVYFNIGGENYRCAIQAVGTIS